MRVFGIFVVACVILSLIKSLIAALVVMFVLLLLWGVFFRPQQTLALLIFGVITSLLEHHPALCVSAFAVILTARLHQASD